MKRTTQFGIALAVISAGCSSGGSNSGGKTITLGAIIATTGDEVDTQDLQSAELAVTQINAYLAQLDAGFLAGATLVLKNVDDASDPATAATVAQTLITQNNVPAIIGCESSSETLAVIPVAVDSGVIVISGSSTSPALTTAQVGGTVRLVYRTVPSDALQGKLLAELAKAGSAAESLQVSPAIPPITKAAALFEPGAYGQGLAGTFVDVFADAGGTITAVIPMDAGLSSYQGQLTDAYAGNPQAILMVTDNPPDGAQVITNYLQSFAASNPTVWFFTDGLNQTGFVTGAGSGQSSFTFPNLATAPASATGALDQTFQTQFTTAYGNNGANPYLAGNDDENYYDAVYILALAMQAANSSVGTTVAAKMQAVTNGPGTTITPANFLTAMTTLAAGQGVTYSGPSGSTAFNATGDVIGPYEVWTVTPDAGIVVVNPDENP